MPQVVVRYQTKPEAADENQRLVERVFSELNAADPGGLRYATFRLEDGVTFVHVASVETGDGVNPLTKSEAFAEFQSGIRDRCVEPPGHRTRPSSARTGSSKATRSRGLRPPAGPTLTAREPRFGVVAILRRPRRLSCGESRAPWRRPQSAAPPRRSARRRARASRQPATTSSFPEVASTGSSPARASLHSSRAEDRRDQPLRRGRAARRAAYHARSGHERGCGRRLLQLRPARNGRRRPRRGRPRPARSPGLAHGRSRTIPPHASPAPPRARRTIAAAVVRR